MLLTVYLLFIGLHVSEGCTLDNREQLLTITAHRGGSVLLPCSCTDLQTKPEEFSWKRPVGNTWEEMPINSDQYRNRVQLVNDHSPGNLSLLISHLTEEDGGDYECAVKGSHLNIRLTLEGVPTIKPTAVVNVPTSPPTSITNSSQISENNSPPVYVFICIPVSLLLMGLGGIIYRRCRGRRRGQTESQEQRRTKREEKSQDDVTYCTTVHNRTPRGDEVMYSAVVHSRTPGTPPTVIDVEDKTEYATIKLNK